MLGYQLVIIDLFRRSTEQLKLLPVHLKSEG
jgi:hypothetical protein